MFVAVLQERNPRLNVLFLWEFLESWLRRNSVFKTRAMRDRRVYFTHELVRSEGPEKWDVISSLRPTCCLGAHEWNEGNPGKRWTTAVWDLRTGFIREREPNYIAHRSRRGGLSSIIANWMPPRLFLAFEVRVIYLARFQIVFCEP